MVDSPVSKASAIAAVAVEAPLDTVLEEIVIVGTVASYVHVKVLETALLLPAVSAYALAATEIVKVASLEGVKVAE